jgi:hypothetical protein
MVDQRLGRLTSDDGTRSAAIEHETGDELRPVDAGLGERRRLHRDQDEIGGE